MKIGIKKQIYTDIAKMHFIEQLSQKEISKITNMSRSNISRIIKKCIADGIVEIRVNDTISLRPEIAKIIQDYFKLKAVIIAPSGKTSDQTSRSAGEKLAMFLDRILEDGMLLGVSHGRTSYYAARSLNNRDNIEVDTIQIQGGISANGSSEDGHSLALAFASKLRGRAYVMNCPLMVKSKETKQNLLNSVILHSLVEKHKEIDAAIFNIERPKIYTRSRDEGDLLSRGDLLQLREVGVVSSACGYFFNDLGIPCNVGINDRILAIDPSILKTLKYSIGIALDKRLFAATLSILRNGMINTLILDENLAIKLKDYIAQQAKSHKQKRSPKKPFFNI